MGRRAIPVRKIETETTQREDGSIIPRTIGDTWDFQRTEWTQKKVTKATHIRDQTLEEKSHELQSSEVGDTPLVQNSQDATQTDTQIGTRQTDTQIGTLTAEQILADVRTPDAANNITVKTVMDMKMKKPHMLHKNRHRQR